VKVVVQRAGKASVKTRGAVRASIGPGLLCLVGVGKEDSEEDAASLAGKTAGMRIFDDGSGRMNLDIKQIRGEILSIPQFTLFGRLKKGNRPSFDDAAHPEAALELWERYNGFLAEYGIAVKKGAFKEHMEITLVNDGPATIILDSKK
jgi:D-aminoacyl-tRNA deacylase